MGRPNGTRSPGHADKLNLATITLILCVLFYCVSSGSCQPDAPTQSPHIRDRIGRIRRMFDGCVSAQPMIWAPHRASGQGSWRRSRACTPSAPPCLSPGGSRPSATCARPSPDECRHSDFSLGSRGCRAWPPSVLLKYQIADTLNFGVWRVVRRADFTADRRSDGTVGARRRRRRGVEPAGINGDACAGGPRFAPDSASARSPRAALSLDRWLMGRCAQVRVRYMNAPRQAVIPLRCSRPIRLATASSVWAWPTAWPNADS